MARGRGGYTRHHNSYNKAKRKKEKAESLPKRKQYEEFGEAHPIEQEELNVKRRKVKDSEENDSECVEVENADESSSDEENGDTDAVSQLLATFSAVAHKAIDSDEEDDALEEEESSEVNEDSNDEDGNITVEPEESDEEGDDDAVDEENTDGEAEQDSISTDDTQSLGDVMDDQDNTEVEEEEEEEEEEGSNQSQKDTFSNHFEKNLCEAAAEQVKNLKSWTSSFKKWPTLGRIKIEVPNVEIQTPKLLLLADDEDGTSLPNIGDIPKPPEKITNILDDCNIRKALCKNIPFANICGSSKCPTSLTDFQKELLTILSNYSDLYFPQATFEHWEQVRTVYAVHAINHILKTRKKIVNHTLKITKAKAEKRYECSDKYRDQGYARPKVLILLPFKHSAYRLVETIITLLFEGKNTAVQNHSRFQEDFGPGEGEDSVNKRARPEDFQETFKGDISEDFKIGLKLTKSSLKLYADFYHSDIIIASPLGLRYVVGNSVKTDAEADFLTSIEVLILDQADVFMMQNWEHVLVLMETINHHPHDIHKLDTDLTRVRLWSLDGHSKLYRQTVIFSATLVDHNRALINKCTNFTGRLQVLNPVEHGSVQEVVVQAELVLSRISGMRDPDSRFQHFTQELLPQFRSSMRHNVLVYIPDYCDYIRLVRYLKEDGGTSAATINEYMVGQNSKVAKARSLFFDGKRNFLLYTERFHFYRRYRIKGVRHIIFYDVPSYPHFFSEICNLMVEGNQNPRVRQKHLGASTVTVLFQRSDLTKLVGVLGSTRAGELINSSKSVHLCMIGK
ncbi:U3 small nucleolar RNA-associated protein 25 homolog [Procambarus clarkii]|uniref:U3 small nucleolar RNA-associated protein 25 homolog n=1 Tax=Procambarus clarkii TaxID=6728 RepID=UPI001E6748C6|nr:U3 small nucleolar RNA-associated protein 25 homolog [Procambarus clarkii]